MSPRLSFFLLIGFLVLIKSLAIDVYRNGKLIYRIPSHQSEYISRSNYRTPSSHPFGFKADPRSNFQGSRYSYDDSSETYARYHGGGNRYYTNYDPYINHRNFEEVNPDEGVHYTVRTGSEPDAQDGPIVAFYSSPSGLRNQGGKFYVRDIPFYF